MMMVLLIGAMMLTGKRVGCDKMCLWSCDWCKERDEDQWSMRVDKVDNFNFIS